MGISTTSPYQTTAKNIYKRQKIFLISSKTKWKRLTFSDKQSCLHLSKSNKSESESSSVMFDSLRSPCTVACQAPLTMGFPRQEHYSVLPFPPLGDLSNPGIKPKSLMSLALAGRLFTTTTTWETPHKYPVPPPMFIH